ncbi:MAG: OsmC family protein [Saprospiraceae bacterium]|jgi:putative redox protein|nr:OsmC family protein [Saprospiraceae bacterium]HQW95186.1 OsmC family protein [Saprospiraceae bacterium]
MKIHIKRINEDFQMEAVNEEGNTIMMDGSPSIGGANLGMRPMQLLLAAIGGCSAIDVIHILKKQRQDITSFSVEVDGMSEPVDDYSLYRNITVLFRIKGNVDVKKAQKAAQLSFEKYCSVSKTLEHTANIEFKVIVE